MSIKINNKKEKAQFEPLIPNNIISFPRSGQHMNERILAEFHQVNNIPYKYCELYNCCQRSPCKYNSVYQKNHDFDLSLKIQPNQKYLFLYRKNKLEQLEAYYRSSRNNKQDYKDSNEYLNLLKFCRNKSSYYDSLVTKFVNNESENILCINYDDYLNYPSKTFHKIINFFGLNYSFDYVDNFIINRDEKIQRRNNMDKSLLIKLTKDLNDIL